MKNYMKLGLLMGFAFLLVYSVVLAASAQNSPTACSGQWSNCANANANDANRATATATNTANKTGIWNNYGFFIPGGSIIDAVTVRADFFASNVRGYIAVKVSGDGGATYGPAHIVGGNTAEQTYVIDVTADAAWTPGMLSNGNLVVNVTCFKQGGGSNPACRLDWLPVTVNSTPFDFSVSTTGNTSVEQARSVPTNVTVTLLSGNSQNVSLAQTGCPPSATCTFDSSLGLPTYQSTLTVATTSLTPAGKYTITVNGSGGGISRIARYNVTVTDSFPSASAFAIPDNGTAPLEVNFTGSVVGGNAPLSFYWNFTDDGTNSTEQNTAHTFITPGVYNITFKVTDFDGDKSVSGVLINVT